MTNLKFRIPMIGVKYCEHCIGAEAHNADIGGVYDITIYDQEEPLPYKLAKSLKENKVSPSTPFFLNKVGGVVFVDFPDTLYPDKLNAWIDEFAKQEEAIEETLEKEVEVWEI